MRIYDLVVEEGRKDHITRLGVDLAEVRVVVFGAAIPRRTRQGRIVLTGQTLGGRYLTVVVIHRGDGVYALITARDANDHERRAFRAHRR